jgi:Streptomyces sporulation and cell division protein, SsgA
MSLEVAEMNSTNRGTISVEQEFRLVGPDHLTVLLTADLRYRSADPYAVTMLLDTFLEEPVEWALDRDLLTAALHAPEGIGDFRAWPSAAPAALAGNRADGGEKILNIELGPPAGCARFEASAAGIGAFLARTYELVPAGEESACLNLDAELAELLSQA